MNGIPSLIDNAISGELFKMMAGVDMVHVSATISSRQWLIPVAMSLGCRSSRPLLLPKNSNYCARLSAYPLTAHPVFARFLEVRRGACDVLGRGTANV
jgi:hypothetical protein